MLFKVKLKNADKEVILDDFVYEKILQDSYLKEIGFLEKLRLHSSGCCVFQKNWTKKKGNVKIETIYLHKFIAERFIGSPREQSKTFVGAKNGNKLDCRIDNLEWRTRSESARNKKTNNPTGLTGVYMEKGRFRSIITYKGKSIHIGMFDNKFDAARAYNKKAKELYGEDARQNKVLYRVQ